MRWNSYSRLLPALELRDAVQGMDDVLEIKQQIENGINGAAFDINDETVEKVAQYYLLSENGRQVRSFLAFPLVDAGSSPEAFGVVDIHCNLPLFLGDSRRQEIFANVVTPLVFDIALAVKYWLALTSAIE